MRRLLAIAVLLCLAGSLRAQELITVAPVRSVSVGGVAGDVCSRVYANRSSLGQDTVAGAVHEDTHQLNSAIRQCDSGHVNGVYLLGGKAAVIVEPRTTLERVAAVVPRSMRGDGFRLYLVEQRRYWNNEPLCVLDEWSAYYNAALCTVESGRPDQYRLGNSAEFAGYSFAMLAVAERDEPSYDARQLWAVVKLLAERTSALLRSQGLAFGPLRTADDAEWLRAKLIGWYGEEWCRATLSF